MDFSTDEQLESESDDPLFIRTEDSICLSSLTGSAQGKCYFSTWFGQPHCYVEREKDLEKEPCNMWRYTFMIQEAISVHAIHGWKPSEKTTTRKMVLYGQAILLTTFGRTVRCFSYDNDSKVNAKDKHINYQIGYFSREEKDLVDATCWFTIHPTTKRQTGERVRAGDEIYLVNVATKRYLSILTNSGIIDENGEELDKAVATFSPWSWSVNVTSSGVDKENFTGYLNGGDAIQIKLHHGKEECLSVPLSRGHSNPLKHPDDKGTKRLCFEDKSVIQELRSLWMVELFQMHYAEAFVQWGQPFRLKHVASGRYLGVNDDQKIVLLEAAKANKDFTSFCFVKASAPKKHVYIAETGMGKPTIKFGESELLLYQFGSEVWIGLESIGRSVRRRRGAFASGPSIAFVHRDPPISSSFVIKRNFGICLSANLAMEMDICMKKLAHAMSVDGEFKAVNPQLQQTTLMCLNEAFVLLKNPNKEVLGIHGYQRELMFLRNRQIRLNNHGSIKLTFGLLKLATDHYSVHPSPLGLKILETLCRLLAGVTADNPVVCRDFASEKCLNALIDLMSLPYLTHPMLNVLDGLFENSPEALTFINEQHIESFVKLLNVNGRETKIMKLLGKLCFCQDLTMRDTQQQVCKHLLRSTDLLIRTKLLPKINCLYANIFIDVKAKDEKWYFELHWKPNEALPDRHVRVGFAIYHSFRPHPSSNSHRISEGGIGDNFTSLGFDGKRIWIGGSDFIEEKLRATRSPRIQRQQSTQHGTEPQLDSRFKSEGINCIGCCYDTEDYTMWFTMNGRSIPLKIRLSSGEMQHISLGEVFIVPALSVAGGVENVQMRFGGECGELMYKPPDGYSPIYLHEKGKDINIRAFVDLGDKDTGHLKGPQIVAGQIPFIPSVVDTSQVEVNESISKLIEELPLYMHEAMIAYHLRNGWKYGPTMDYEKKTHPGLRPYHQIEPEHRFEDETARSVVMTLCALGCVISESLSKPELKYEVLDSSITSSDEYCPKPLVTIGNLPRSLSNLKECLAENFHNKWAERKLDEGFRYGLKKNYKAKTLNNLLPYHSLPLEDRERNRSIIDHILQLILTIGYSIQPPMIDLSQNLDDAFTQIPFRTYRGQYYQYCTGRGKWYFTVKLIKGQLMRVGWVTHGFCPSLAVGGDEFSYSIDGFRANKWHNGKPEKFGCKWKVGDTIICLLDLERQTMSFAIGDTLLHCPSQETTAFSGLDRNKWYIPAITLYLAEEAEFNLGKLGDAGSESIAAAGFEGVQTGIKSPIPLWYSDDFPVFRPIQSDNPSYSSDYTKRSITVNTVKVGTKACFKLNMGVPILEERITAGLSTTEGEPEEVTVSYSICFPSNQDTEAVFLGWCAPEWIYSDEYWNERIPDSIYSSKIEVLGQKDRILDVDSAWKVNKEHCSAFIVRLSALLGHMRVLNKNDGIICANCVLNTLKGEMIFYCDGYSANKISLKASFPTKLFPVLVTTPSQSRIAEFIFEPVEQCLSLKTAVFGDKLDSRLKDHVLGSMEILHCAKSSWRQINTLSLLNKPIPATANGCSLPKFTEQELLYLTLAMEERIMRFSEIFENHQLADFHLEIFKTLKACCMHDNIEAGRDVKQMISWDHLLYCIKSSYWDYSIRAAYFDLFNTLHLEHLVNSQLLVQNDHIFAIEASKEGVAPPVNRRGSITYSALTNEISLEASAHKLVFNFPVNDLKAILFMFLEKLMLGDIFTCRMLVPFDITNILRPLIVAMDSLVVLRQVNKPEEIERLLNILHPTFGGRKDAKPHQALLTMSTEEPIKMALCDLLEHLCNCQLQSRLEHIVKFAETYVEELQEEQQDRVDEASLSSRVLQEINSPTEKQIQALLSFINEDNNLNNCPTGDELRASLNRFHKKIKAHCGVPKFHVSVKDQLQNKQNLGKNLAKLMQLLVVRDFTPDKVDKYHNNKVTRLQEVIKNVLMKWARDGIKSTDLIKKIFQLFHRQFNETEELMKALGSTYVVEKVTHCSVDEIIEFRESLGHVRNLLRIGIGDEEEKILEDKLRILQLSSLFSKHPDLLRLTGVHLTIINIIKSYLSFNTSAMKSKKDVVRIRLERKRKMAVSGSGFLGPVEECCKFLEAFTKTSRQNQAVLFEYIPYLLDQCLQYPDRLGCNSCSPLEVASAIIKDNLELALALSEDIFKKIMVLMEKMTYGTPGGGAESESDTPLSGGSTSSFSSLSSFSSMSMEWSPFGSLKCLKFLYAAVWVNGETVVQNASVIIRLLIQYPESLGPGTLGKNLGIVAVFQESMSLLVNGEDTHVRQKLTHQETTVRFERDHTLDKKNSSILNLDSSTVDVTLSFYTFLVRLLAFCTPLSETKSAVPSNGNSSSSHSSDHVIPFLQSLISFDDVKKVLSMPLSTHDKPGIRPKQKQAMLTFLDRVYGFHDSDFFLYLIKDVFLSDIIRNTYLCQRHHCKYALVDFYRYLCDYILPFLKRHAHHINGYSMVEVSVVTEFIKACHRIIRGGRVSMFHRKKIDSWLVTISTILPPQVFLRMIPEAARDIQDKTVSSFNAAVKIFHAHFEHFHAYYSQGVPLKNCHPPGRQTKIFIALMVSKLIEAAFNKTYDRMTIMQCLKALISAITPECLTPDLKKTPILLNRIAYHECPQPQSSSASSSPDLSEPRARSGSDAIPLLMNMDESVEVEPVNVQIPKELLNCIELFADHCHNQWVYKKQQLEHWIYGPKYSAEDQKNPYLRPFSRLDEDNKQMLLSRVKRCVEELLLWGYAFTRKKPFQDESLPPLLQLVCIRVPKKKDGDTLTADQEYAGFVPDNVIDLDKIKFKNEGNFQVIAEATAVVLNDLLHVCGQHSSSDYNPLLELYKGEGYEQTVTFIINLLKFFQIKGLLCCGAYMALPGNFTSFSHIKYTPFGKQLFDKFLNSLDIECSGGCGSQEILCPLINHYLECHASYFNPLIDTRETTQLYVTTGEKIQIAKMLSRYLQYLKRHTDDVFQSPLVAVGKGFKPPSLSSIIEFNEASIQRILNLTSALLKALDFQEEDVITEINSFIQSAAGILEDFPAAIEKESRNDSSVPDMKFLVYCLHILIPILFKMFRQFNSHTSTKVHLEVVNAQSSNVFTSLFNPVKAHTDVFLLSDSLTTVGDCLSALSLFQGCQFDVFGNEIEEMMEKLKWAAARRFCFQSTAFVGSVLVPLLASTFKCEPPNSKRSQKFLKLCLRMLHEYQGEEDATWIYTLCVSISSIAHSCPVSLFASHILPVLNSLSDRCNALCETEKLLFTSMSTTDTFLIQRQREHTKYLKIFSRDVTAILKFLTKLLNSLEMSLPQTYGPLVQHDVLVYISSILDYYFTSRRFAGQLDAYNKSIPAATVVDSGVSSFNVLLLCGDALLKSISSSARKSIDKFISLYSEDKTPAAIECQIGQALRDEDEYKDNIDLLIEASKNEGTNHQRRMGEFRNAERFMRILSYTKHYIQQFRKSKSTAVVAGRWKTLLTRQKREAVLLCLKAIPFYKLKKHRAVNLFLNEYSRRWLIASRESNMERLCDRMLDQEEYESAQARKISTIQAHNNDPLHLLFSMFKMLASTQQWHELDSSLYEEYCETIVETTKWVLEDESEGNKDDGGVAKSYERFHNRMALASNKQKQLLKRDVPSMILLVLAASEGRMSSLVHITIKLGLVLLEGGNTLVQQAMLDELNSMDADVVISIQELVSSCSTLDLTSYERNYMSSGYDGNIAKKVFPSSEQVIDLFRFLQLLCEGHNEDFQNYLRTQNHTTTTVNIVVATVDYLLKLQESVRDFYWHHAHNDSLDFSARECFLVSFQVTRQVFRTLTEYIQGPCAGNQQTLSQSRLWDAISGYFHIFTSLQEKLFSHIDHMELLREVLDLEEEFFIFLLSMLEGNTLSSSIARHMSHMLMECEGHVASMIKFYCLFIKLADTTISNAFKEYDLNKDGFISYQEFERSMNQQQHYTKEDIEYLMQMADTNKDGLLDYKEFTNRFHQPAHNLGFRLCALFQQLSDILPHDHSTKKLMVLAEPLIQHFKGSMGCVEIVGKSSQVERVYFRIKKSRTLYWEDPTIKESRKRFLYNLDAASQREKLEEFVHFCEDTIFDMNYNDTLKGVKQDEELSRAEQHRSTHYPHASNQDHPITSLGGHFDTIASIRVKNPSHLLFKFQSVLNFIWINILFGIIIKPVLNLSHFVHLQMSFHWHKGKGGLRSRNFSSIGRRSLFQQSVFNSRYFPRIVYSFGSVGSLLANIYHTVKRVLLFTTLLTNVLILVSVESRSHWFTGSSAAGEDGASLEGEPNMNETTLLWILKWLTRIHFMFSILLIMSSYNRNGQVILFKHEKKTVRRLEKQTIFTSKHLSSLTFIDRLIIKSPSFPRYYYNKQAKERVLNKLGPEQREAARAVLGMEVWSKFDTITKRQQLQKLLNEIIDVRYALWKFLVIFQDSLVLYHSLYCLLSFAGLYLNVFYFSIHLLDLMFHSSTLVTVLKSLQINMKQLIMTLAMTCVVLYIYTVIGFNYFRKFYQYELSEGVIQDNCDSMWNCFFFHLDKGLRSGGGIADVLVSATGDQQYMLRLSFDMTFFFIVIVILLAVFQGLIIDAFGELRKKQDSITEELQNKCFVCGIGKNEFGSPQEFERHVTQHHSIRDYMFFMMHLIEKPETEFTGQESHVWEHYVQQDWSFFPSGTCFQLQEKQRLKDKADKGRQIMPSSSRDSDKPRKRLGSGLFHSKTIIGK